MFGKRTTTRKYRMTGVACVSMACLLTLTVVAAADEQTPIGDPESKIIEVPVQIDGVPAFDVKISTAKSQTADSRDCPPAVVTHSGADFAGGEYILQQGFVAGEIAAVSFTLDPGEFPIIVNVTEMIFAQAAATQTTTTEWSLIVWRGTPDFNDVVAVHQSDDVILPHIVFPPSSSPQGVNVQVTVDPEDPEQIVVQDDGSHTFSVGYRIDAHHQPATSACNFGFTPAQCCPPGSPEGWNNAFPTVDANGMQHSTQNWLRCREDCGALAACSGWTKSSTVGISGDWNIRVTYTPFSCVSGACCDNGACTVRSPQECGAFGHTYMGDGTGCLPNPCAQPTGACCDVEGMCTDELTEAECEATPGSFWQGQDTTCATDPCPTPVGACCNGTGGCFDDIDKDSCETGLGGIFAGNGTVCADDVCELGACCMPDGSCGQYVEMECFLIGGEFLGVDVECDPNPCPQPTGACCLDGDLCVPNRTEDECLAWPGEWAGPLTTCDDNNGNDIADVCETAPECLQYDLDLSGFVGTGDINLVKANYGPCASGPCEVFDLDGSGFVGTGDINLIKANYGPCP